VATATKLSPKDTTCSQQREREKNDREDGQEVGMDKQERAEVQQHEQENGLAYPRNPGGGGVNKGYPALPFPLLSGLA